MGDASLIINYLPQTLTKGELYTMFITIGPIQSCHIMRDYQTNYSYGFGFVNYHRREDAEKAIKKLDGLQLQNKKIKVSFARKSTDQIKDTNVYITNIPRNLTSEELRAHLEQYGEIIQFKLLNDKSTGMPRGVAFVRYNLQEQARAAIQKLNGTMPFDGSDEVLVAKLAVEHGKQKAAYYTGWIAGLRQGSRRWRPLVNRRGQSGPNASGKGRELVNFGGQSGPNASGRGRGLVNFGGQSDPNASGRGRELVNFGGQPIPNILFPQQLPEQGRGMTNFVTYPIRRINPCQSGGVGPVKRGLGQHRFNPMARSQ